MSATELDREIEKIAREIAETRCKIAKINRAARIAGAVSVLAWVVAGVFGLLGLLAHR